VPRIDRTAELTWEGNAARGSGTITAATGAFTALPYSQPARIARAADADKTSPEELLAAAHGACLTMSLATELSKDGTPPGSLSSSVLIVMDEVVGEGHQIVESHVRIRAEVDGADAAALAAAVERADAGCPFSKLLRKAGVLVDVALA
jgi:osmotically inducible protein OsmC